MQWHVAFGITTGFLQLLSIIPYVRDMLKGTTRPNIVSYILWFLFSIIAVAAQASAGASWSILIPLIIVFNTALTIVLCLRGYGYTKYGVLDGVCFILAIVAIVVWHLTNNPLWALILAVAAYGISSIPTIAKTYREPKSENALSWFIAALASVVAMFATTIVNAPNLIFPIYNACESILISGLAFSGQRKNRVAPLA